MGKGKKLELTSSQLLDIKNQYTDGKSLKELAKIVGCSIPTIRKQLASAGVSFRAKGRRSQKDQLAEINTEVAKLKFTTEEDESPGITLDEFKDRVTRGLPFVNEPSREW